MTASFWDGFEQRGFTLISEEGSDLTSKCLERVRQFQGQLQGNDRGLCLLQAGNHPDALAFYLACLRARHPVILLDRGFPAKALIDLRHRYPIRVVATQTSDGLIVEHLAPAPLEGSCMAGSSALYPGLAVLLPTSGSTGSPKLVRLSYQNLQANAESIVQYLGIGEGERAITSLPLAYSYGLSVINSHMAAGAGLVVTNASLMEKRFWTAFRSSRVTSLAGVPTQYDMLERMRFREQSWPHLRYMTQAGGRLEPGRVGDYADWASAQGKAFFVMYGQTEATARMTYLPLHKEPGRAGSIGVPIPGGRIRLLDSGGNEIYEAFRTGELVYEGPNVMMGYAQQAEDLARGPEVHALNTGDLAHRDNHGFLYIDGRKGRMLKVHGKRIDLDGLEIRLQAEGYRAWVTVSDEQLVVALQGNLGRLSIDQVRAHVDLPPQAIRLLALDQLPMTPSGKPDYQQIAGAGGHAA